MEEVWGERYEQPAACLVRRDRKQDPVLPHKPHAKITGMVWWRKGMVKIKKGQRWRKKRAVHGEFILVIIGKTRKDKIKTMCSDGNTHSFDRRILFSDYEPIEE